MWSYYGKEFEAPTFALGIEPAGNLYATTGDLGRFLAMLFADGQGKNGRVLQRSTLESMYQVQFEKPDAKTGFGLGFAVSDFHGHRCAGHNGRFAATVLEGCYRKVRSGGRYDKRLATAWARSWPIMRSN